MPLEAAWRAEETAEAIIDGGAKTVVSSAPAKNNTQVASMDVNVEEYDGSENSVSRAPAPPTASGPW